MIDFLFACLPAALRQDRHLGFQTGAHSIGVLSSNISREELIELFEDKLR